MAALSQQVTLQTAAGDTTVGSEIAPKNESRGWLAPACEVNCRRLPIQLAPNRAECSDQSSAKQQQRAGLRRSAALVAYDVEGTNRSTAEAGPGVPTVSGIELQAVYALVVQVPRHRAIIGKAHRTENHEIRLSAGEGDSRNTADCDQTAAASERLVAHQVIKSSVRDLHSGEARVVRPNAGVESKGRDHLPDTDINRVNAEVATAANGEQARSGLAGADDSRSAHRPTTASRVDITGGAEVAEECC